MAKLTRLATTVTARYYSASDVTDAFYLDGRLSGKREALFLRDVVALGIAIGHPVDAAKNARHRKCEARKGRIVRPAACPDCHE